MSGEGDGRDPRVPRDVQGLLKYCIEAGSSNQDEQQSSSLGAMSEEVSLSNFVTLEIFFIL